ncbi:MAG: tyrosine-type recombinase/integrase [Candidatus Thermoplasmatota archaeon]|nr:tyrosine-type recombinase/integrase [Candidatus Thermoplasmatota archaeon]
MSASIDLYNYKGKLKRKLSMIKGLKDISKDSKDKILKFQRDRIAEGIGHARILRYLDDLPKLARMLDKDFQDVTAEDLRRVLHEVEEGDLAEASKTEFRKTIKVFYRWLNGGERYPECVEWIKTTDKRNNNKLPEELLTEEEVKRMISVAWTPRDRAIISLLWESGCRVGELLNMRIKHVSFEEDLTRIAIHGKTGARRVPLLDSTPYLAEWLDNHPQREDSDAFLWVGIGTVGRGQYLKYPALRKMLVQVAKKTNVKKKVNPHNFRHSRATFLANHLTEAQMNQYLGWVRGSDMPATYVHLSGRDVDDAILKMRGLKSKEAEVKSTLAPKKCPRCDLVNKATGKFCNRCGAILDVQTAMAMQDEIEGLDEKFSTLLQDEDVQKLLMRKMVELGIK